MKLILFLLLVISYISYETGFCEIVGFQVDTQQRYTTRGQYDVYCPYLQVNMYFNNSIWLFNGEDPLVRMYKSTLDSCMLFKSDAKSWQSNYNLGQNYTCYFDDRNNVYIDPNTNSTSLLIIMIVCSCICMCVSCIFLALCIAFCSNHGKTGYFNLE